MKKMQIGLIREEKIPVDRRVALSPTQCKMLLEAYSNLSIICQPSQSRCFSNLEYTNAGVTVQEDVSICDYLMGIKEVPIQDLIPNKKYFFFSHTIKKQAHNRMLLMSILDKMITLIDYECLVNEQSQRVVAFGKFAGIVGAYNAIITYGKKYQLFDLKRAYECFDLEELKKEFSKIALPPIKIVVTGTGKVGEGVKLILDGIGIQAVAPAGFLQKQYDYPVYTMLRSADYNERVDGSKFESSVFHQQPELFKSSFYKYAQTAHMLIAGAYWNPKAPLLFTKKEMRKDDFSIRVIADITCDINGSIPSTQRASTIDSPWYDYNPITEKLENPFSNEKNIAVMAIDNLPCELPRDASISFGEQLIEYVLPNIVEDRDKSILERATIAKNGKLTERFSYLESFIAD